MKVDVYDILKNIYPQNKFIELLKINIKNTFETDDFKISFKDSKIFIKLSGGYQSSSSYKISEILTNIIRDSFEKCEYNFIKIDYKRYFNDATNEICYEADLSVDEDKLLDKLRIKLHNNKKLLEELLSLI